LTKCESIQIFVPNTLIYQLALHCVDL